MFGLKLNTGRPAKLLLAGMLGVLSLYARAADWTHFGTAANDRWLLDKESVRLIDGRVAVWVLIKRQRPQANGSVEERQRWLLDCKREETSLLSYVEYNGSGVVLVSKSLENPRFTPAVPESIGAALLESGCAVADQASAPTRPAPTQGSPTRGWIQPERFRDTQEEMPPPAAIAPRSREQPAVNAVLLELDQRYPGWADISAEPEYKNWVQRQNGELRQICMHSIVPRHIVGCLNLYLRTNGRQPLE